MKNEIVSAKGQASVFETDTLDSAEDARIVAAFREARKKDFEALRRHIQKASLSREASGAIGARRVLRGLGDELARLQAKDFFGATGGEQAAAALAALQRRLQRETAPPSESAPQGSRPAREAYRKRTWFTRPRPGVDRMASAWLIRRYIDPAARFRFGEKADPGNARLVPFDAFGAEFSHHGDRCTFEVMADRFGIAEPAVERIAEVVHDLDLKDERYRPPEAGTMQTLIEGLQQRFRDDHELLEQGIVLFEGLYHSFAARAGSPAVKRRKRVRPRPRR
jgi:hypothetical protein